MYFKKDYVCDYLKIPNKTLTPKHLEISLTQINTPPTTYVEADIQTKRVADKGESKRYS